MRHRSQPTELMHVAIFLLFPPDPISLLYQRVCHIQTRVAMDSITKSMRAKTHHQVDCLCIICGRLGRQRGLLAAQLPLQPAETQ